MRTLFNKVLVECARKEPRIWMILADIGYGEIEPFREAFPGRWYNCGVAEQNMTGVACGVAMEGNIAITYSIANFPTLRCLEQIRNDVCYHNANVKIVIIGAGLAYGPLGVSHQATEDIAILRALPNMVVFCPCDFAEAEARFAGGAVPRPAGWSGFRVQPDAVEFWYGAQYRLHERQLHERGPDGTWTARMLYP